MYSLSCIVPKAQFDGTGDITGSNQIDLIRQSQVESFKVTTATTSLLGSGETAPDNSDIAPAPAHRSGLSRWARGRNACLKAVSHAQAAGE